jgi:hypothetical protein
MRAKVFKDLITDSASDQRCLIEKQSTKSMAKGGMAELRVGLLKSGRDARAAFRRLSISLSDSGFFSTNVRAGSKWRCS